MVRQAQTYLGKEPFVFYLGDNIVLNSIGAFIEEFETKKLNCLLALSKVPDPTHFGVPVIEGDRIVKVIEKPTNPVSPYAVTGIYLYDHHIFDAVADLKPSSRGEYEISDAHTWLIEHGFNVGFREITGWWKDTGRAEDLLEANRLLLSSLKTHIAGDIGKNVSLQGPVVLGNGTIVDGRSLIRGPVIVGENCVIRDSYIGPFTSVGNRVELYNAEVEQSLVFDDADIHVPSRIVDSIIGANATIIPAHSTLPSGHKLLIGSNSLVEL